MKRVSTDASVSGYNHAKLVQAPLATQKKDAVLSTVTWMETEQIATRHSVLLLWAVKIRPKCVTDTKKLCARKTYLL